MLVQSLLSPLQPAGDSVTPVLAPHKKVARPMGRASRSSPSKQKKEAQRTTVFLFGELRELALYRADVLESKGFEVMLPRTKAEAISAIQSGHFHIAILSYTLDSTTVQELAELIRQHCPECPLVTISKNAIPDRSVVPDEVVNSELGPSGLVEAVQRVAKRRMN
jgi:CheY-like chemotaxis protein